MDTFLTVVSRREVRKYDRQPISEDAERRILEAGRLAGSAQNRQARRFVVLRDPARVAEAARAVFEPTNLLGAALIVAVVTAGKGPLAFDAGRAAQNMLLTAWGEGIGGSPNGIADAARIERALSLGPEEHVAIVLSFGHPLRPSSPERRTPQEWIDRANRLPFEDVVEVL